MTKFYLSLSIFLGSLSLAQASSQTKDEMNIMRRHIQKTIAPKAVERVENERKSAPESEDTFDGLLNMEFTDYEEKSFDIEDIGTSTARLLSSLGNTSLEIFLIARKNDLSQQDYSEMLKRAQSEYRLGHYDECLRWASLANQSHYAAKKENLEGAKELFNKAQAKRILEVNKNISIDKSVSLLLSNDLTLPAHLIWKDKKESFNTEKLARLKRIFLMSNTPQSFDILLYGFFIAPNRKPEKLMDLVQELALGKGLTTSDGLEHLAGFYFEKGDLEATLQVLQNVSTPEALLMRGEASFNLYQKTNKEILLKNAIQFYEESGLPNALKLAGNNYKAPPAMDREFYLKKYQECLKSNTHEARFCAAHITRLGLHGEEPDIHGAKQQLLIFKEELETSSNQPEILDHVYSELGSIYQTLSTMEHYDKDSYKASAVEFFQKSSDPISKNSLACILEDQGKMEEASQIYSEVETIDAQLNLIAMNYEKYKNKEKSLLKVYQIASRENLTSEDLGNIIVNILKYGCKNSTLTQKMKNRFGESSNYIGEHTRSLIQAKIACLEGDYDQAYLYISKIALTFSAEALNLLKALEEYFEKESTEAASDMDLSITDAREECREEDASSDDFEDFTDFPSEEEDFVLSAPDLQVKNPTASFSNSSDDDSDGKRYEGKSQKNKRYRAKQSKAEKRRGRQIEKVEESLKKHKKKLGNMLLEGLSIGAVSKSSYQEIQYIFKDQSVREDFQLLKAQSTKFQELLKCIEECPWETKGYGKPEVLRHKYKGYRGCISRRLNDKDRLVYKVTGPGEVLIIDVEGHYKTR